MRIRAERCDAIKATSMVLLGYGLVAASHAGILITNISLADESVTVAGSGGTPSGDYVLLATADVELHPRGWTILSTNSFDAQGSFRVSHATDPDQGLEFFRVVALPTTEPQDRDLIGFASLNGGTSGGAGGPTVTVSTPQEFRTHIVRSGPLTIQVRGAIDLGNSSARPQSNKTLLGLGGDATLIGNLRLDEATNVIVRNLHLTNPAGAGSGDGLTIQEFSENIWVDHCTFYDCKDGNLDITHGSDNITVSWCVFHYKAQTDHRFSNLIGHSDNNAAKDRGRLHITFHHNWWSERVQERMPRVRFGRVHCFNNYFNSPGNNYCIRAALESEILVENNYFEDVDQPWEYYTKADQTPGKIEARGNAFSNVTGRIPGADSVFIPPYDFSPDTATKARSEVKANAGAGRGSFAE